MKNLSTVFLTALIALCLFHCKSDKEETMTFEQEVLGDWEVHSFLINSCPETDSNVPEIVAKENGCLDMGGYLECHTINFRSEGTGEIRTATFDGVNSDEYIVSFTYDLDESSKLISLCPEGVNCNNMIMRDGELFNELDEGGCICIFEFHKE